jgi:hypothetical protein
VARRLNEAKLATLLIDGLTADEEAIDLRTGPLRFAIGWLAERLVGATDGLLQHPDTRALQVGDFGASPGAGARVVRTPAPVGRGTDGRGRPPRGGALPAA